MVFEIEFLGTAMLIKGFPRKGIQKLRDAVEELMMDDTTRLHIGPLGFMIAPEEIIDAMIAIEEHEDEIKEEVEKEEKQKKARELESDDEEDDINIVPYKSSSSKSNEDLYG